MGLGSRASDATKIACPTPPAYRTVPYSERSEETGSSRVARRAGT